MKKHFEFTELIFFYTFTRFNYLGIFLLLPLHVTAWTLAFLMDLIHLAIRGLTYRRDDALL